MMLKNKLETNRWLRAIEIAKVVFWHERYHTLYLEQIEDFIRSKRMYSPRIKEELIPALYKIAKTKKVPMTKLVNRIVSEYLEKNIEKTNKKGKVVVLGNR